MIITETTYKVGNFKFDNIEAAETFNNYFNIFNSKQLKELYKGYKSKIDYKVYANPKFDDFQMAIIREGLELGLDVSLYANQNYN